MYCNNAFMIGGSGGSRSGSSGSGGDRSNGGSSALHFNTMQSGVDLHFQHTNSATDM